MNVTQMNLSGHRDLTESKMKMTGNNLNYNENISDPPPIKNVSFSKKNEQKVVPRLLIHLNVTHMRGQPGTPGPALIPDLTSVVRHRS